MNRIRLLQSPRIQPLFESDIDIIFASAGAELAHFDTDLRSLANADYRLGNAVIELKLLDDEVLLRPEHQARIAALLTRYQEGRTVVVVDPRCLPSAAKR